MGNIDHYHQNLILTMPLSSEELALWCFSNDNNDGHEALVRKNGGRVNRKLAIHPTIVDLRGKAYDLWRKNAARFLMDDLYRILGPLQFDGPGADSKAVGGSLTTIPKLSNMIGDTVNSIFTVMLLWPSKGVVLMGRILVDTSELELKPHENLGIKSVNIPKISTVEWLIAWEILT